MTIEITHTRREGTLIHGTRKGDGSAGILKTRDYRSGYTQVARWSRNLGCWYLPHSRDKRTSKPMLETLAERLRAEGFAVTVTVDETDRRTFAEAEQDRAERADDRAARFAEYAGNAAARSDAARERAHRIADGIPFGQPILVGHHSERRARRDQQKIENATRTGIAEGERAAHWVNREHAAARYEQFRTNPARTLRRIEKLRADLRAVEKWQRGEPAKGFSRDITLAEVVEELAIEHAELAEQIAYWEEVVREAEERGFKVWSKADFQRGDFARRGSTWFEVLRVNTKSVTIPHIHNGIGKAVVRAEGNTHDGWTWTLPYDQVAGRRSADEMRRQLDSTSPAK